jgi:hypothetical protein
MFECLGDSRNYGLGCDSRLGFTFGINHQTAKSIGNSISTQSKQSKVSPLHQLNYCLTQTDKGFKKMVVFPASTVYRCDLTSFCLLGESNISKMAQKNNKQFDLGVEETKQTLLSILCIHHSPVLQERGA